MCSTTGQAGWVKREIGRFSRERSAPVVPPAQRRVGALNDPPDDWRTEGDGVIKIFVGVAVGYALFTQPQGRQVTADLLRAAADALAPAVEDKTLEDRINEVLIGD